jgi:lipopolysaccharide assembly protein A
MKTFTNFLISTIAAVAIAIVAIFSIQNIEAVSLRLIAFESIRLPVGVLLSFCFGGGMILGAIAPLLLPQPKRSNRRRFYDDDEGAEGFEF